MNGIVLVRKLEAISALSTIIVREKKVGWVSSRHLPHDRNPKCGVAIGYPSTFLDWFARAMKTYPNGWIFGYPKGTKIFSIRDPVLPKSFRSARSALADIGIMRMIKDAQLTDNLGSYISAAQSYALVSQTNVVPGLLLLPHEVCDM